jgi:hypothetical protein
MKNLFIISFVLLFAYPIFGQQSEATISWEETTFDFGSINEEDGVQTATFTFSNTGNSPLFITNVRSSCGCTTPDWSKEPVQPGEKGYVKAAYNPRNRPGNFNKSVTVTTNTEPEVTVLRIKGNVIKKTQEN